MSKKIPGSGYFNQPAFELTVINTAQEAKIVVGTMRTLRHSHFNQTETALTVEVSFNISLV